MKQKQDKHENNTDKVRIPINFKDGDKVCLKTTCSFPSKYGPTKYGPCIIKEVVTPTTYLLMTHDGREEIGRYHSKNLTIKEKLNKNADEDISEKEIRHRNGMKNYLK